jgi:hypothetical protein
MIRNRKVVTLLVALTLLLVAWQPSKKVRAESEAKLSRGQAVYVPVYSHIYTGDREHTFYLAVTLSIRNTDPKFPITILTVDYYDSDGKLVRKYLEGAVQLKAMGSTRYIVKESDKSGGSGANFVVTWKSDHAVHPPIVESIMIGTRSQQGISFTSRGRVISEASK